MGILNMKCTFQRFLLILLFKFLLVSCMKSESDDFLEEKKKIRNKIASMQLGNYIRKLMLKNNELIDESYVFIDNSDFEMDSDELNYSNMDRKDQDNEFKARLYAYKFVNGNRKNNKLTPYSVDMGGEKLGRNWNNYNVLLMNDRGENKLVKVCFTKNLMDNFGLVMDTEKPCKNKIDQIKNSEKSDNQKDKESDKESSGENKEVTRISKNHKIKHRSNKRNLKRHRYKKIIDSLEKKSKNVNDEISDTENEINKLKKNTNKKPEIKKEKMPLKEKKEEEKIDDEIYDTEDLNLLTEE